MPPAGRRCNWQRQIGRHQRDDREHAVQGGTARSALPS
jgi:hypothetical protein